MTISISPETQKLLEERLRTGGYASADELLRAALSAFGEPLDEATLDAIDEGEDDLANGRVHDWENVRDQITMIAKGMKPDG